MRALTELAVGGLVDELARVIAPGGFALLDVGPTLRDEALTRAMTAAGFEPLGRYRSWWLDPTGQCCTGSADCLPRLFLRERLC